MPFRFSSIYFIRNNAGTYEAWQDNEAAPIYSGTDLVTNVLNSIEAAHPTGKFAVLFGVGSFDMGTGSWTLNTMADVLLAGSGIGSTHVFNNSSAASDTEVFSITNCDRITVRDMDVTAGGGERSTSDALDFDNSDNTLVERVRVLGSRASGIVFDGKDAGAQAIGNIVRDCVITNTLGTVGHGIKLLAADRTSITGCHIHDTVGAGISIQKASATAGRPNAQSRYNVVSGNRIHNCGRDGVEIISSSYNVVTGNSILNSADDTASRDGVRINSQDSIQCDGNIITGNICGDDQGTATQRYGVNIGPASAGQAIGTVVSNNTFFTNLTGAINRGGTNSRINNNTGAPDNRVLQVSAAYTIRSDDAASLINVNSNTSSVTITLPNNATANGRSYVIRRDGTNNVTVTRSSTNTIGPSAATSLTLGSNRAAVGLATNGDGNWKIISTEGTVT